MENFVFGLIGEEDLARGTDTFTATLPDGSTGLLSKVNLHSFVHKIVSPAYGTSVTINAESGDIFVITATDTEAFFIETPVNPRTGQAITIRVKNSSGGTMGDVFWSGSYLMAALPKPSNGFSKSITFYYDGTAWVEISRTSTDVPNA